MNAAALQAWLQQNQKAVLGVAAAGAVGLGVMRARKTKAAAASGAGGSSGLPAGTALASGPAIAGTATPYDSSVSDVYNSLQGQIDKLTAPMPVTTTPATSEIHKPTYGGFWQVAGQTAKTYIQDDRGNLDWLTPAEMTAFGVQPGGGNTDGIHVVPQDGVFWKEATYIGDKPT